MKKRHSRKKVIAVLVTVTAVCIITILFIMLLLKSYEEKLSENTKEDISREQDYVKEINIDDSQNEIQEDEEKEPEILSEYKDLYDQNNELYGWLKIDDTIIDYPVMHTPDDPQKYLYLGFNEEDDIAGTLFMDYRDTKDSDNLIIYGHNMKNMTMFGSLPDYKDISFYEEHPVIHFDTLYEKQDYEVAYAFYDQIYSEDDTEHFKYYHYIDAEDEEEYDNAIQYFAERSVYDTGITPEYGDQLIMLITCAYHVEDGRFVVVARKIEE